MSPAGTAALPDSIISTLSYAMSAVTRGTGPIIGWAMDKPLWFRLNSLWKSNYNVLHKQCFSLPRLY